MKPEDRPVLRETGGPQSVCWGRCSRPGFPCAPVCSGGLLPRARPIASLSLPCYRHRSLKALSPSLPASSSVLLTGQRRPLGGRAGERWSAVPADQTLPLWLL